MRGLKRPVLMLGIACLAWMVVPTATTFADEGVARQTRTSRTTAGPTPHLRVVCYNMQDRKIPCSHSADVAVQEAHRPYREPYALWPSRYTGVRSGWFGWW